MTQRVSARALRNLHSYHRYGRGAASKTESAPRKTKGRRRVDTAFVIAARLHLHHDDCPSEKLRDGLGVLQHVSQQDANELRHGALFAVSTTRQGAAFVLGEPRGDGPVRAISIAAASCCMSGRTGEASSRSRRSRRSAGRQGLRPKESRASRTVRSSREANRPLVNGHAAARTQECGRFMTRRSYCSPASSAGCLAGP